MIYFRIKNWEHFQHYKDRNPPWIKLHREVLSGQTWVMLDDAGRALAIACMLLAASNDNLIPANPAYVKRVAYLDHDPDLLSLLSTDFIEFIDENGEVLPPDSQFVQALAPARPETEAEQSRAEAEFRWHETTPKGDSTTEGVA